jgi:hypothetical protein
MMLLDVSSPAVETALLLRKEIDRATCGVK